MKRILIGKIIGTLGLILFTTGLSYLITYQLDRDKFQDINILVTFEDSKEFTLENLNKLDKESAMLTYPYIFEVKNEGKSKTSYKIKIKNLELNNLEKENLNYILIKNDLEVKSGSLIDLEDNLLYNTNILKKEIDIYKLYIYLNQEIEDVSCKYSLIVES
ncbi:MAG: hypothetical protein IJ501_02365 [Bacilli bacterium]|nr:hypothetical protein [Bacilli bacterium]